MLRGRLQGRGRRVVGAGPLTATPRGPATSPSSSRPRPRRPPQALRRRARAAVARRQGHLPLDGLRLDDFAFDRHRPRVLGDRDARLTYDLVAVVNHIGGLSGGHYTCACRVEQGRPRPEALVRRGSSNDRRPDPDPKLSAPRWPTSSSTSAATPANDLSAPEAPAPDDKVDVSAILDAATKSPGGAAPRPRSAPTRRPRPGQGQLRLGRHERRRPTTRTRRGRARRRQDAPASARAGAEVGSLASAAEGSPRRRRVLPDAPQTVA